MGTTEYFFISVLTSLFFSIPSAYIILKHRFFDIKIALQEIIIFFLTAFFISLITFSGAIVFWVFSGIGIRTQTISTIFLSVVALTIFYNKMNLLAEFIAGKFFSQSVYDYEKTLQEISSKISSVVESSKLSEIICNSLSKALKLDQVVVLVRNIAEKKYQVSYSIGLIDERKNLLENQGMFGNYFKQYPQILVFDEIINLINESSDQEFKQQTNQMYDFLEQVKMGLIMPLVESGSVEGLVFLGNKVSNNPYSVQDINLLTTILSQASVALANTQLYQQIFDLNKNLEQKVKEETKQLHEKNLALEKTYKDLKSLDVMKDQLVAITSHELKSPLSVAQNYLWSLINKPDPQTKLAGKDTEKLTLSLASIQTLVELINTILDVSKIEAGKLSLDIQKMGFDTVKEIINKVLEEFGGKVQALGLKLSLNLPTETNFIILADPVRLEEVLTNLISNAIKYTPKGSIKVSLEQKDKKAVFSVTDTGRGVAKVNLPHLFEKFYREDTALTASSAQTGGTGLGLYISKSLVELMGGKIQVESKPGKGSTFFFSLPVEK